MSDLQPSSAGAANTQPSIHRGLAGVVADTTSVSVIDEGSGKLLYRGYPVPELAESFSFEEVAYLIWHGELPTSAELASFCAAEREARQLPAELSAALAQLPVTAKPMDALRSATSFLGAVACAEGGASGPGAPARQEGRAGTGSMGTAKGAHDPEGDLAASLELMAKLPTVVAALQRARQGKAAIAPDPGLGFAENFFYMCNGSVPGREVLDCFETSLVLYAEHGFNASTFTARVITSTGSDIYSAVTGAIGALKGPLHGGANEAVMTQFFFQVRDPQDVEPWLERTLAAGNRVMGFGHRVYKHGDSRVPMMRLALERLSSASDDGRRMMAVYARLEDAMREKKGLYPNLDYPTGPAYHLMGFEVPTFTPIFVMSRITGWTAHIMEQKANNALIRPLSAYVGTPLRPLPRSGARQPSSHRPN
jgi:citrate synthase